MPKSIKLLLGILTAIAYLAFLYGVIYAGCLTLSPRTSKIWPPFLAEVVMGIGNVLATNLGAVLGISIAKQGTSFNDRKNWRLFEIFTNPTPTTFQIFACYLYIGGLFFAGVVWAIEDFNSTDPHIVPLIPLLAKTLLSVIVGALAVSLQAIQTKPKEKELNAGNH